MALPSFSFLSRSVIAVFGLFSAQASMADSLTQQRENYQQIQQILSISSSTPSLQLAQNLLPSLQGYVLYADAESAILRANPALTWAQVADFQQRNPQSAQGELLAQVWLQQAQKNQQWQQILAQQNQLPSNPASQCIVQQAQWQNLLTNSTPESEAKSTEKTSEKNTALLALQQQAQQLWLTELKTPASCEPLLALWQQQGGLNDELIWQRAQLALQQGNSNELGRLANLSAQAELKAQLQQLKSWLENPQQLAQIVPLLQADKPEHKQLLLALFPQYIKKLSENQLDSKQPFAQFSAWAQAFQLSENQQKSWLKAFLSQIFDSENTDLQQWRDQQIVALGDDSLLERRVRMALRQQQDIQPWLNGLSAKVMEKEEWRYWQAKKWQQQGKKAQAEQAFKQLSQLRGFYPMLAAQELDIDYQPEMQTWQPAALLTQTESKKLPAEQGQTKQPKDSVPAPAKAVEKTLIEQLQQPLARIAEWRYFKQTGAMNKEWAKLLQGLSFEQKLELADYAQQQQWFDLSVEATIQAKAWGYLSLRLPNAYLPWFDLHLQNLAQLAEDKNSVKNSRTFVMAIARQESAWRPEASSAANARGLMQLLPSTAKQTAQHLHLPYNNEKQLFEPFYNIMLGTAHLQELAERYQGNRILMAAAYNAGAHRVDAWLAKSNGKLSMAEFVASIPFFETRGYVQNVLAYDYYYQLLQGLPHRKFSKGEYDRLY